MINQRARKAPLRVKPKNPHLAHHQMRMSRDEILDNQSSDQLVDYDAVCN